MAQSRQAKAAKLARKKPGPRKFKKNKNSSPKSSNKKGKSMVKKPKPMDKATKKESLKSKIGSVAMKNQSITKTGNISDTAEKKKRVSFSSRLVESDADASFFVDSPAKKGRKEEAESAEMDTSTPLKPILKKRHVGKKSAGEKIPKKKKIRLENGEDGEAAESSESEPKKKKKILKTKGPNKENQEEEDDGAEKFRRAMESKTGGDAKPELMSRKERKEHLLEIKAKRKPYLDVAVKAKKLWEQIRNQKRRKSEDRQKLIDELYGLVEGKVKQLIYAHDTVRVIQCLMALKGNAELRTKLFDEVKDEILTMSKSKYARFFVIKMLKYGTPAQREYIMQCFYGKIPKLMKHAIAAEVVEYAYNEYANAVQRSRIVSEFYSPEYSLFKVDEVVSLDKIIEKEPERKSSILQSIKDHISDLSTKPVLKYSLAHRLIREFFDHCSDDDKKEAVDLLKERIVEMVHTKDGVLSAMKSIWYGTPKERKIVVRTLKSLVVKLAMEEHGHLLLLAIFDAVDDTLLVQKVILKEITQHMDEIARNKYGAKVIQYLLKPRCNLHFMKEIVTLLAEGDTNPHSKKDAKVKHQELLSHMSPVFLQYATEKMKDLMKENPLLVLGILENAEGDRTEAYRALCNDVLAEEFIPMNIDNLHAIEKPQTHFALKRLIKNDKILAGKGEQTFSETLIEELTADQLLSWMSCNKGAFLLVFMYETEIPKVQEKIAEVVKSTGGKKKLKQYTFPAAKILAQKIL